MNGISGDSIGLKVHTLPKDREVHVRTLHWLLNVIATPNKLKLT